jgi:hypothetical protein
MKQPDTMNFWMKHEIVNCGNFYYQITNIPNDVKIWFDENDIDLNYAYHVTWFGDDLNISNNIISGWWIKTGIIFNFDNDNDAIRFKLAWC